MPGWRIGFAAGNARLIGALTRIKSYLDYGAFTPVQVAPPPRSTARRTASQEFRELYRRGATSWSTGWPGRLEGPQARRTMFAGRPCPAPFGAWARWASPSSCSRRPRSRSRRASASASTARASCAGPGREPAPAPPGGAQHPRLPRPARQRSRWRAASLCVHDRGIGGLCSSPRRALGTVGSACLLREQAELLAKRVRPPARRHRGVSARDRGRSRSLDLAVCAGTDAVALPRPEVDLVCELIGERGIGAAAQAQPTRRQRCKAVVESRPRRGGATCN